MGYGKSSKSLMEKSNEEMKEFRLHSSSSQQQVVHRSTVTTYHQVTSAQDNFMTKVSEAATFEEAELTGLK